MQKGRPRKFDEKTALSEATLIFWRKGYRNTSIDDLTSAMLINRPSLYAAFGDKEELFLSVIDHYRATYMRPIGLQLMQAESLRSGLLQFFIAAGSLVCGGGNPPGCLIACLLSEDCCESEAIRQKLCEVIAAADDAFTGFFEKHRHELCQQLTARAAGQLLNSTIYGISIRARSGASLDQIRPIAEAFISAVAR